MSDPMGDQVFGLPVGYILNEDETPLEVLGCVKYLDADGNVVHWVFNSEDLTVIEAVGMAHRIRLQCEDDMQTDLYLSLSVDDDDDED